MNAPIFGYVSLATKQRPSVPAAHSVRRRRADARVDPFDRLDYALGVPLVSHGRAFVRAMTGDSERQPLLTPASEGTTGRKSGAWASRLAGACGRATREPSTETSARSTPRGSSRLSTPAFPAETPRLGVPAPVSSRDPHRRSLYRSATFGADDSSFFRTRVCHVCHEAHFLFLGVGSLAKSIRRATKTLVAPKNKTLTVVASRRSVVGASSSPRTRTQV